MVKSWLDLSAQAVRATERNVRRLARRQPDCVYVGDLSGSKARKPNGGLIVMPDTFTDAHRVEITSLAARYRLPAVYPYRQFTSVGGLLSYGDDLIDNFQRAPTYVDRILKGAKPSELPVQAPVRFELVINLKTAKALGLDVPPLLQQRADEVIE
jgi:putative ABC transport system substrate-binding protein